MKNVFVSIITLFYFMPCFAQDTTDRKNKLTDDVIEKFSVRKANKDIKEGKYQALFQRRTLIASGHFSNNKKTGIWNFYKPNRELVETFDYDKNTLTFESATDTLNDVHYLADEKLKPTDSLIRPIKIGGIYYGFIPYLTLFQLPFDTFGINMDSFDAYVELLISPLGRLADYKVYVSSANYQYKHTFNLDVKLFNEEDREFFPLILNNKPILSRIIIKCFITSDGRLDFY